MKKFSLWTLLVVFLIMFVLGCGGKSTSIEGKVVGSKGQPLANVKVVAKMLQPIKGYEKFETTTSDGGYFKFGKLFPTSEYQLIFLSWGSWRWIAEKEIKIVSGPEGQTKELPEPVMIRFVDFRIGVVLDTKTNLMWATQDNGSNINWANAKSHCETYRGGGYTDWRMPTQDELAGLYDESITYNTDCYHTVHLTELIHLTCIVVWASETRGSDAACFVFMNGLRNWHHQSHQFLSGTRALPVRSDK